MVAIARSLMPPPGSWCNRNQDLRSELLRVLCAGASPVTSCPCCSCHAARPLATGSLRFHRVEQTGPSGSQQSP
jgi:hypothetical protein